MAETAVDSKEEFATTGIGYTTEVVRELLFAVVILMVAVPPFYLQMIKYADDVAQHASDPAFQDSIRKMIQLR